MNKLFKKLKSSRGETLAEMLVSIVILGLSVALMLTMIMTSTKITQSTRQADQAMMNEMNAAEEQSVLNRRGQVNVRISGDGGDVSVPVYIYAESDDSKLISYSTD